MCKGALEGIKVLEYSHTLAGAYCAKQFADLGAEVLKIEKPAVGDETRRSGPFPGDKPHSEKSGLFIYVNTNKLGITLDPTFQSGKKILSELVKKTDILIEDHSPGVMEGMNLGYEDLSKIKSDIIVTSITPFGQTGPYSNFNAYGLNIYQGSGLGYITPEGYGYPDKPPLKQGKYVTYYYAGIGAALVTLGVLYFNELKHEGIHIDFSIQEWLMNLMKPKWEMYSYEGFVPNRKSVVRQGHRPVICKDGYLAILILEEHQWIRLSELAGKPEWLTDPRFNDPYKRAENGDVLTKIISDWAKDYTMLEIYEKGQKLGVPIGMFNKPSDLFRSEQLRERKFLRQIKHPFAGDLTYPWVPFLLSETPGQLRSPAPLLGEHNKEIYCKRLGLTDRELVSLHRACII